MAPKRIQMSRQRPWRAENPDAVIVARPSRWGNPFPVERWGLELSLALFKNTVRGIWNPSTLGQERSDEDFAEAYSAHTDWSKRMNAHPLEMVRVDLAGRDLACWCPVTDESGFRVPCHADVLLELANAPDLNPENT